MPKHGTIHLPERMDVASIHRFAKELDYYYLHDKLTVDFGSPGFFSPYAMLFIASKLKSFRQRNEGVSLEFRNYEDHPYAARMGFFRMFGMEQAGGGKVHATEDHLPITRLTRASLYETPGDQFEEVADLIQRHADKIALLIARDPTDNKDMFDALSYSVREIMRNVFEHSGARSLYYCAQYWPKSNKVEFAVVDFGVGIRRGLSENPNFRFRTDKEAIEYSLLPSVSGKTHLPRTSSTWFNSGYGLYMTNRLARNGGNFVVASGTKAVHLSRKTKSNFETSFPGTAVRFNLDVNKIGDVQARLNEFRKDGAELARTISGSGNRPPSAMSLLLRRDYAQ